jgi:hypothetical protein
MEYVINEGQAKFISFTSRLSLLFSVPNSCSSLFSQAPDLIMECRRQLSHISGQYQFPQKKFEIIKILNTAKKTAINHDLAHFMPRGCYIGARIPLEGK